MGHGVKGHRGRHSTGSPEPSGKTDFLESASGPGRIWNVRARRNTKIKSFNLRNVGSFSCFQSYVFKQINHPLFPRDLESFEIYILNTKPDSVFLTFFQNQAYYSQRHSFSHIISFPDLVLSWREPFSSCSSLLFPVLSPRKAFFTCHIYSAEHKPSEETDLTLTHYRASFKMRS